MASAWGKAWGVAWGNAWGALTENENPFDDGGGGSGSVFIRVSGQPKRPAPQLKAAKQSKPESPKLVEAAQNEPRTNDESDADPSRPVDEGQGAFDIRNTLNSLAFGDELKAKRDEDALIALLLA